MSLYSRIHSLLIKLFFAILACCIAHAYNDTHHCRISARHIEGGGIGYKHGYTTLEGFFAADPKTFSLMPFADARAHVFNDGKIATNIGFGLRTVKAKRVYGANVYYDYRKAKKAHYNQLSFGVETLGTLWDLRVNGYFPVGTRETALCNPTFDKFSGNHMLLSQKYQYALTGVHAELGFHCADVRSFGLYAAVGPYYFSEQRDAPHAWGAKARLACSYKEYIRLELSNSYDTKFHNRFQCQLTFTVPFGKRSKKRSDNNYNDNTPSKTLYSRMVQPVEKDEIIVVGKKRKCSFALNPATGEPFQFIFVDNTSNSFGTYESPYPTLALTQEHSKANDIIYVFPGDGTTTGMDRGIILKRNQNLWGSGVQHTLHTTQGDFIIPAQSSTAPQITNTDVDTEGNGVTLDTVNQLRGLTIIGALSNGVFGTDLETLDISHCSFVENNVFTVDASFIGQAVALFANNDFERNVNGININVDGPSTLLVSNNVFNETTSVSSAPLIISAGAHPLTAVIENNSFTNNTCGATHCILNDTDTAQITVKNNLFTNNGTGAVASFGAPLFINPNNTTFSNSTLTLANNTFSHNAGPSLFCANGSFNRLRVDATNNTLTDNDGGGLIFATGADNFTLNATNNSIMNGKDHGITTAGGITMTTADITISNNTISGNTNFASGIALSHEGTNLNLVVTHNDISHNDTSGITMYATQPLDNVTAEIASNTISFHQNLQSNAASGIDIEQFNALTSSITNNMLSNNTGTSVFIGSTASAPSVCLEMRGNSNDTDYTLSSGTGSFNLAPCDVATVNTGIINTIGVISPVESCPSAIPCSP